MKTFDSEFTSDNKPLRDVSQAGKVRPWKKHKLQSLAVAYALSLSEKLKFIGEKIESCATYLEFKVCPNNHGRKLIAANFCKNPSCILCNSRKSEIIFHQVFKIVHEHLKKFPSDIPLLLTLTVPNCKGEDLKKLLSKMSSAFNLFSKRSKFKKAVRAWFRSLEITVNEKEGTYHPHYHLILMVPEYYFKKKYNIYIDRPEYLYMWKDCMRDPSITQVDIRKMKNKGDKSTEMLVSETSKYATKPSSYIKKISENEYWANPKAVQDICKAIKRVRFLGFGGTFKEIRKRLKMEDVEKSDLIKLTDEEIECKCKVCNSDMFEETYGWKHGLKNYFGIKNIREEVKEIEERSLEPIEEP